MTKTITVACRLLQGMEIELNGRKVVLNGYAKSRAYDIYLASAPKWAVGLTQVDADFWEAWQKANKDFPPLRKGLLFVQPNRHKAQDAARDTQDVITGFERINPQNLPRGMQCVSRNP